MEKKNNEFKLAQHMFSMLILFSKETNVYPVIWFGYKLDSFDFTCHNYLKKREEMGFMKVNKTKP